jgi:predicted neuraminidase
MRSKKYSPTLVLCVITLLLHALPLWRWIFTPACGEAGFAVESSNVLWSSSPPFFSSEFITTAPALKMVHAASICQLGDDRLAAVWYEGSHEIAHDTVVRFATRSIDPVMPWSSPQVVVSRQSAARELHRYVKAVGNAVIASDANGRLLLVYATIAVGRWSGSSLNFKTSQDGGTSWSPSRRLTLSPFLNLSELVRNNPLPMGDGKFAIPVYHEFIVRFPEMLWIQTPLAENQMAYCKSRMAGGKSYFQPTVAVKDRSSAMAFYRNGSDSRAIARAVTHDGGMSWSAPGLLELPNPNAGINALMLSRGRMLLAFNDSQNHRSKLNLAVSLDGGVRWSRIATLEDENGEEYSYPYMIQTGDGNIHLVYTWRRQGIKHMIFNEAWVDACIGAAGA